MSAVADQTRLGVLARATTLARRVAGAEVELLREPFLDQVIDRGMEGVQPTELLTGELGKRSVNTRNST